MKPNFTPEQLADWVEYEEVRACGLFNMFDPQARRATGLTREAYMFVLENYSELKAMHEEHDSSLQG